MTSVGIKVRKMDHWSNRLRHAISEKGWTHAELARHSGVSKDSVDKYAQGAVDNPRGKTLSALADALHVDRFWLSFGGEDGGPGQQSDSENDIIQVPSYGFRAGMGGGGVVIDEEPNTHWPVHKEYLKHVRLENADLISIEVEGDSMSPTLESGDQVLINQKDRNPARGGIFTIHDSDTLVVKRIEKIPGTDPIMLRLISDNPHHNAYDVIADDTKIIGRVVWFARRL